MEDPVYKAALARLMALLDSASSRGLPNFDSAALATCGVDARPSVRMINVFVMQNDGAVMFFANRLSGKGRQLAENPRAAICLYWPELQEQVIVEGIVKEAAETESDRLWTQRTRESQLAAWAAPQGETVAERGTVRQQVQDLRKQSGFDRVPRQSDWHAYSLEPARIEFWPSGWHRARERVRYVAGEAGVWSSEMVSP
ncbi:MAG: pyridoxamine 5'-phosphate oxidase [Candidatus Pseudothioglobus sp.]|jgi:pyridoxamine 5'-phosphate oxidase